MDAIIDKLLQQPIALVAFGLGLAMVYAVRQWGLKAGEKTGAHDQASAQVAAVIVDPTALNNATHAVSILTKALSEGNGLQVDHAHMLCRRLEKLTEAVEQMTREAVEIRIVLAQRR
ncbi:hypothetical protein G6L09_05695 [Agrobacterium rhizogenes]|nr:hypothetical protein [Rhizobium rhizogenes]NTH70051.1 hypothetical protein [Rhizobium rhizogenes]